MERQLMMNLAGRCPFQVYGFNETSGKWMQLGGDINGKKAGDISGWSVSLSNDGRVVAVGAVHNDGNFESNNTNSGHVRIFSFDKSSNEWIQLGTNIDGEATGDLSG
eukprot:14890337-Ditylum_brightwellii.AAC.1